MRDGAFRTADAELKAYSDKLWYHLRLEADLDAHTVTVKVNHQTKGTCLIGVIIAEAAVFDVLAKTYN